MQRDELLSEKIASSIRKAGLEDMDYGEIKIIVRNKNPTLLKEERSYRTEYDRPKYNG